MEIIELKQKDIKVVREILLEKQNGICPVCKKKTDSPVLDHSHQKKNKGTGLCRAVICNTCNGIVGVIENRCRRYLIQHNELPFVLRNIADYLEAPHTNYLHPTEFKKMTKEEYDLIKKYYLKIYPRRRKIPPYPENELLNKDFKKIFKEINKFIKNESKSKSNRKIKSGLPNKNSSKRRIRKLPKTKNKTND